MRYNIMNKIIEYNLLTNDRFNVLFDKYKFFDEKASDITIDSKALDEILMDEEKITCQSDTFAIIEDKITIYAVKENGIYIGRVICDDENGVYHFEVFKNYDLFYVEYLLLQAALSRYYTLHLDAIFIHSSAIMYKEKAILFSALSGTGKSTHARLWEEYYGAIHINDDKNFIVFENDVPYIYGNPMSGKHYLDSNVKAELLGIVFLHQAKENSIRKLKKAEVLIKLMSQIQIPYSNKAKERFSIMLDRLINIECYSLGCTISKEAVDLVKNSLFKAEV